MIQWTSPFFTQAQLQKGTVLGAVEVNIYPDTWLPETPSM